MNKAYVYKKRLLKLADKLSKLPVKRFDYDTWVGDDYQGKPDLACGTTACALGWATTIPSLRRAGLRLAKTGENFIKYVPYIAGTNVHPHSSPIKAGREIFGLDEQEFDYLFIAESEPPTELNQLPLGPDGYATPKK